MTIRWEVNREIPAFAGIWVYH